MIGLNEHAFATFVAYRKKIKKPLREVSHEAAQKRLASFGDHEAQMESVLTTIANGWQGVFPPTQKAPAVKRAEEKQRAREESERIEWQNLEERAARAGFRPRTPLDDLLGYQTLVQRAEANRPRRSEPQPIADLFRSNV